THTLAGLDVIQEWTAAQTFDSGKNILKGATSGTITLNAAAIAGTGTVITLPGGTTDFSATGGASFVLVQATVGAAITVRQLQAADMSNGTSGSGGGILLATGPTMTNPVVGTQTVGDNSTKAASTAYVL